MSLPVYSLIVCPRCNQSFTSITDGFYLLDSEGPRLKKRWNNGKRQCPSCEYISDEKEWRKAIKKTYGTEYDIEERGFPDFIRMINEDYNKKSDYYKFPEGKKIE